MAGSVEAGYFRGAETADLSTAQVEALTLARAVLHEVRPSAVDPTATTAVVEGDTLRLVIPHVADHLARIELEVERWGEVGVSCPPLGADFYLKFNAPHDGWDASGDLADLANLVRALLDGRVEAHLKLARRRIVRSQFFLTTDGKKQSIGVFAHLGAASRALLGGVRTEIRRVAFFDRKSPYVSPQAGG